MIFSFVNQYADHSYMLELNTPSEEKLSEKELTSPSLDLSNKGLKKVPKTENAQNVKELILDDNALQKIDNIDSFLRIEKVCDLYNNWHICFAMNILFNFHFNHLFC